MASPSSSSHSVSSQSAGSYYSCSGSSRADEASPTHSSSFPASSPLSSAGGAGANSAGSSAPVFRSRPLSCGAVARSSELSIASSSSCSSATLTPKAAGSGSRPASTDSAGSGGPPTRTLVQPRTWRIVPRARGSHSLDRERAMEEDTSLEGDDLFITAPAKVRDEDAGSSCVDGGTADDVFTSTTTSAPQNGASGSSVDPVVGTRAKSESDILDGEKNEDNNNTTKHVVGFKSKAQRFSSHKDNASTGTSATSASSFSSSSSTMPRLSTAARQQQLQQQQQRSKSLTLTPVNVHPLSTSTTEDKSSSRPPTRSDSTGPPSSSMSRSLTLPIESSLVRRAAATANGGDTDSADSTGDLNRRSRSTTRSLDGSKSVKFSEPAQPKPDPPRTLTRSASADKSPEDSPTRNITVNLYSNTARVSFSKASKPASTTTTPPPPPPPPPLPPQEKPKSTPDTPVMTPDEPPQVAVSETLVTLRKPLVWVDKPEVPAKPARSDMVVNGHAPPRDNEIPPKPPRLFLNGQTSPMEESKKSPTWTANAGYSSSTLPRTSAPGQAGRRSATLSSAQSPIEDVLFSMGFTIADDGGRKPPQPQPKPKYLPDKSHNRSSVGDVNLHTPTALQPAPKKEEVTNHNELIEVRKEDQHPLAVPVVPVCSTSTDTKTSAEPAVEIEIVPKKMTKIKGDHSSKKAEEKAAKARKKAEQKAKEKELKAKKKSGASSDDSSDHHPEKVRMKLFPFKVEFSKDKHKNSAPPKNKKQDKAALAGSKEKELDVVDGKRKEVTSPQPAGISISGVLMSDLKQQEDVMDHVPESTSSADAAAAKKTDKGDGNCSSTSTSSSSKSPTDKKGSPSSASSPQDPPSPQQQQQQQQQQQPDSPPPSPQHQQPTPSPQQQQPQPLPSPSPSPQTMQDSPQSSPRRQPSVSPQIHRRPQQSPSPQLQRQQQQQQQQQQQPPPKPRHSSSADDPAASSSDQNSDMDSVYGSLQRRTKQGGKSVQISESDGEETTPQGSLRRIGPRRHTVGSAQIREQMKHLDATERKREAFYELLATRYPQYADKITGLADYHPPTTAAHRNPRPREPQRRRTTAVTYNPHVNRSLDYEDLGTMSDVELSSFQRGGYARGSLPIVRSASTSLERPIGLVFLVYRDETKKALLPNEITSLDTVRALFVRAFPEKLSMEYLDSPKRKIYILEVATSIFFQLEDLRDIQDRTVLKIHECDSDEPQRVKCQPEVRGRAVQPGGPASARPASRQGFVGESGPHFRDEMAKTQSLPVSAAQGYQDLMHKERGHWEMEQMEYLHHQQQQRRSRSRSQTPEPAERPRSLSTGAPRSRYSHSPDRLLSSTTPDRGGGGGGGGGPAHLNPIPENPRLLANGFRDSAAVNGGSHYDLLAGSHSHLPHQQQQHPHQLPHHQQQHPHLQHPSGHASHLAPAPPGQGRGISPTPIYESVYQAGGYPYPQAYVSHSMRTAPQQGPQRATGPPPDMRGSARGGPPNRHSLAFAAMSNPIYDSFPQRTQSYRTPSERDVLPPRPQSTTPHELHRMDRMESQIASLAAWVHQVHAPPTEPVRRGPGSSRSTSSGHSEGTDTYPGSSASKQNGEPHSFSTSPGLSDIPAAYSVRKPVVTGEMKEKINDLQCRMQELRVELQGLRRLEQLNQEAMRDAFSDTLHRLKNVMSSVPGADNQVVRHLRVEVDSVADAYINDKVKVEKDLSDLEKCVEELKEDVINRKCRINVSDVEGLALMLSNITKSLADLKVRFPQVHETLKRVMSGEMEIVVKEEKFLKEEPLHIEAALKRCKKLTSTLCTLKRLASLQDSRPPHIPTVASECNEIGEEEKMAVLESIRAVVPDHDTRVQNLEAADASRERMKKIVTQQESLKFTKSLQTASKALRMSDNTQPAASQSKGDDGAVSATDSKTGGGASGVHFSQDKKSDQPPAIPAKPARLMSASEVKKLEASRRVSVEDSALESPQPDHHAITVTGQVISDGGNHQKAVSETASSAQRSSARSAFFSSMQSPSTSPPADNTNKAYSTSKLPSATTTTTSSTRVAVSGASLGLRSSSTTIAPTTSPSRTKAQQGYVYQAVSPTRGRSAFSSIPLPSKPSTSSADKDDSSAADKGKKVPPPPPPRKSSAKLPYGIGVGGSSSSTISTSSASLVNAGGGMVESATVRRNSSSDKSDSSQRKDSLTYKAVGSPATVVTSTCSGPLLSSTPKPVTPQKPQQAISMSKFQKDLAAGIYSNLNRPDLQNQKVAPDRLLNTMASPPPAAVTTNSQDPHPDEADLSGSESTGSSTSLDSQQGVAALLRANSIPTPSSAGISNRGPKPNPPQRHSSLSAKGSVSDDFSSNKTKTQMLQDRVRRSQDEGKPGSSGGLLSSQMNGLAGAKNGHKT